MISMETAQQQAGSWQPIRAGSGSVSSNERDRVREGVYCRGGEGGVKVNVQRGVYFLVGLKTSAWSGDVVPDDG